MALPLLKRQKPNNQTYTSYIMYSQNDFRIYVVPNISITDQFRKNSEVVYGLNEEEAIETDKLYSFNLIQSLFEYVDKDDLTCDDFTKEQNKMILECYGEWAEYEHKSQSPMHVDQGYNTIIENSYTGKYSVLKPGIHFYNPLFQKVKYVNWSREDDDRKNDDVVTRYYKLWQIPMFEIEDDLPAYEVVTKDKITIDVNAVCFYKIINVEKAVYGTENLYKAVQDIIETKIKQACIKLNFEELYISTDNIMSQVIGDFNCVETWGIEITKFQIQDIVCSDEMQEVTESRILEKRKIEAEHDIVEKRAKINKIKLDNDLNARKMQMQCEHDEIIKKMELDRKREQQEHENKVIQQKQKHEEELILKKQFIDVLKAEQLQEIKQQEHNQFMMDKQLELQKKSNELARLKAEQNYNEQLQKVKIDNESKAFVHQFNTKIIQSLKENYPDMKEDAIAKIMEFVSLQHINYLNPNFKTVLPFDPSNVNLKDIVLLNTISPK